MEKKGKQKQEVMGYGEKKLDKKSNERVDIGKLRKELNLG